MAITETVNEAALSNGGLKGDQLISNGSESTENNKTKKNRESDRRRRRRKQKKNNKNSSSLSNANNGGDESETDEKLNSDAKNEIVESVEIEYVPEKADIEDDFLEEFKNVFEKFSFSDSTAGAEDAAKKDESAANAAANKKGDSDSDEEEQDTQQKEKGISNKKKKLQRRMKIAELKQICSRPDVVEVWDATAADPKLLVFLKSYRNSVPVPRHWCQKRKFLQGTGCNIMEPGPDGVC